MVSSGVRHTLGLAGRSSPSGRSLATLGGRPEGTLVSGGGADWAAGTLKY